VRYFIFLSIFIAQILLITTFVSGAIPWNIIITLLVCIVVFILNIAGKSYDLIENKQLTKTWIKPIFTSLVAGLIIGLCLSYYQSIERRKNAEKIIEAINKFHKETGVFPDSLNELKPKFLKEIPDSRWGLISLPFTYNLYNSNETFNISYEELMNTSQNYDSSSDEWESAFFD